MSRHSYPYIFELRGHIENPLQLNRYNQISETDYNLLLIQIGLTPCQHFIPTTIEFPPDYPVTIYSISKSSYGLSITELLRYPSEYILLVKSVKNHLILLSLKLAGITQKPSISAQQTTILITFVLSYLLPD